MITLCWDGRSRGGRCCSAELGLQNTSPHHRGLLLRRATTTATTTVEARVPYIGYIPCCEMEVTIAAVSHLGLLELPELHVDTIRVGGPTTTDEYTTSTTTTATALMMLLL